MARWTTSRSPRSRRGVGFAVAVAVALGACSSSDGSPADASPLGPAKELRLGYFANVTHAPALVGVARGTFVAELGDTQLVPQVFNAGPAAIEAINAGAVDAAFLGPSPAINGFVRSQGEALRIVAGAASGGAQLVVRPGITAPDDLRGANLATPQLGGTQDVALRSWLAEQGLTANLSGSGDVTITPTDNALTLQLFRNGEIDGAWVPEPWASRLVLEAGGSVLVDERDLWPDGQFPTTQLVVATRFLAEHPETVEALLRGEVAAIDWITAHPADAASLVNTQIEAVTATPLSPEVLDRAFSGVTFTPDPLAGTLEELLADGVAANTTQDASLSGIVDLRILNEVLDEEGSRETVSAAGLGPE
jgi:NitT/TauT family transport system substrate-binding protein